MTRRTQNSDSNTAPGSTNGAECLLQLTPRDLLAEAGREVRTIAVRRNKNVLIADNHYRFIYVNNNGWLLRYKVLHNGSRQIIDFVLPGQVFGLQACLFQKSLYSVATISDASLAAIPIGVVEGIFERSPRVAKTLFWATACESAILAEHLIDAARRSAYERVGHLLLELFIRLKSAGLTDNVSFAMPLTQELIADALGLTSVHVNRTLRALREDKLISVQGKIVTVLDFEALSRLSDFQNSYLGAAARALGSELAWSLTRPAEPRHRQKCETGGRPQRSERQRDGARTDRRDENESGAERPGN
jgi:CRP-like cAMP-binding protein